MIFVLKNLIHSLGICLFILNFSPLLAQKKSGDSNQVNIRSFSEFFYVKAIFSQKIFSLNFQDLNNPGFIMSFQPNMGNYVGIGVNMLDISFDFTIRQAPSSERNELYGNSKGRDWQVHLYTRKHGVDLSYQRYNGFYLSNPESFYPTWKEGDPYPTNPDMSVSVIHLGFYYVFRPERYSFPSVFNHTEAQLRSGGSWFLTTQFNKSNISDPDGIIMVTDSNQITELTKLNDVDVTSVELLPGYSYNIIIKRQFYLNLSLALGVGYQFRSYHTEELYRDNAVNIANTWRLGFGYNGRRLFFGASGFTQSSSIKIQNLQISTEGGFVRFFFGYRFREWGFMQKSIFDLLGKRKKKKDEGIYIEKN